MGRFLCHWKSPALYWQLSGNSSEYFRVAKHLDIVSFNCFVSLGTHTHTEGGGEKEKMFIPCSVPDARSVPMRKSRKLRFMVGPAILGL